MSTPTLGDIAERLSQLSRDLDRQTGQAEELDRKAVLARHAYELAYSRAFLSSTGSMALVFAISTGAAREITGGTP